MTETPRFKILPEELRVIGDGEDDLDILCEAQKNHTLKQVIEWGNEECWGHTRGNKRVLRRQCGECWAELKKEAE